MKTAGKRWIWGVAGLALAGASALASAEPVVNIAAFTLSGKDFFVNPEAIGEPFPQFTAGAINFTVTSEVDQFGGSGNSASFAETGSVQFSPFITSIGGASLPSGDTGLDLTRRSALGYQMYALFSGTGQTTFQSGPPPQIQGLFSTFNVSFYVDRNNDTTFGFVRDDPAVNNVSRRVTSGVSDDVLVLTGSLIRGDFLARPGVVGSGAGDFHVLFQITGLGQGGPGAGFFTTAFDGSPLIAGDINGVNSSLNNVAFPPNPFTDGTIVGSGNTSLGGLQGGSVPEPASLALVGLALVGAGAMRRKTRA